MSVEEVLELFLSYHLVSSIPHLLNRVYVPAVLSFNKETLEYLYSLKNVLAYFFVNVSKAVFHDITYIWAVPLAYAGLV